MSRIKKILCVAIAAIQAASVISVGAFAKETNAGTDTIAVGKDHSLVIKADMSLWSAGDNTFGQLGVGTGVETSEGILVMKDVIAVDAYGNTSFAIDGSGTLYGWGDNSYGQISPSQTARYLYTPVKLMENVVSVSAGESHTVAITSDGVAYGWGSNSDGELGFAANAAKNASRKLMENVVDAAAGDDFTALVTADGKLHTSGDNSNGQLGHGNYRVYMSFIATTLTDVQSAEAGSGHLIALRKDGTVYAAGYNDNNQVCKDSKTRINGFTALGLKNINAVFAGESSSAAVDNTGALYVWGNNDCGQLQSGKASDIAQPYKAMNNVISVAIGGYHSLVLKNDGTVCAAGDGMHGELFDYSSDAVLKPENILDAVTAYSAGADHAAAISDGTLYTWGNNDCGQLGQGDLIARNTPTKVALNATPIKVWCGNKCTFVQTDDLRVMVFGDNTGNMLGMDTKTTIVSTPKANVYLADYEGLDIQCGDGFCIALIDGTVYGWGTNSSGSLCDLYGVTETPQIVSYELYDITMIAAGNKHCLALTSGGHIWGWGSNTSNQLGSVEDTYTNEPQEIEVQGKRIEAASGIRYIDAAGYHSIVVDEDNKVWVWGANSNGQLGVEGLRAKTTTYTGFSAQMVSAGKYACAIIGTSERLMLCGSNKSGALGDGTETDRSTFGEFTANSASYVDLGDNFGGYIRGDGMLYCWGDNSVGQVGNGEGGMVIKPKNVITDALCAEPAMAEGMTLSKTDVVLRPNTTTKLTATVTPADADVKTVKWSSSNAKVATVSADGTVKALSYGEAIITASTINGIKAECKVTVTVPVSSFSVSPSKSKTLKVGQSFTFKTKVSPSTAIDKTLIYESSDPDVAKVSTKGKVTAVSAGVAKITITAKSNPDKVKTVTIYVRPAKTSFSTRKATEDGILFKWKAVDGADGYTIYRRSSSNGKNTVVADVETGETLTCIDANVKSGKTYYYFIRAYIEVNGKKIYSSSYALYKIKAK